MTVSGETFCKLGKKMDEYVYKDMWAGPPKSDGIYDVEDSVTALIRTAGPVITVHGAWAQNIGENEMYIDFMGDQAGIRLQYGADFTLYTAENGALVSYQPQFNRRDPVENEINAFVDCVLTGKKLPSHIDTAIITSSIMQAIYDSAAVHHEIAL
ncbi:MAG: gfo/Idh/MocA family oxidoreductase, partial [Clostridia bacterium]